MHTLDQAVEKRHLLNHPFYQRWMEGTLSLDELKNYAVQYYPHVKAFPTYVSAVHSQCDDLATRQMLLENLVEEEQGEENHPELWLRFAEALGQDRNIVETQTEASDASLKLVEQFRELTRKSFASGIGALYAYESQVPEVATQKIEGLKKHFDLQSERGLRFFSVHQTADQFHAESERKVFDEMSGSDQAETLLAAQQASEHLWNFLSSLEA